MTTAPRTDIDTISGKKFDYARPHPDMIAIYDIAFGLAKVCRCGGQLSVPFSVAQHSVIVSRLCEPKYKLPGLMHDAPEYVMGDMVKPLKNMIAPLWGPIEDAITLVIFEKYNLDPMDLQYVKPHDLHAWRVEKDRFKKGICEEWYALCESLLLPTAALDWHAAGCLFMNEFHSLKGFELP